MNQSMNPEENIMIRKSIIALAAIATLGAAALAPTSASAWGFKGGGWGHHHHHGFGGVGLGFYGVNYVDYTPSCYLVKKVYRSGAVKMIRVCE
jgi:hypothetical protein